MSRTGMILTGLLLLLTLPALVPIISPAGAAGAGSAGDDAVGWSVISGGGAPATASSGAVVLNGSLGQTAIGPSAAGALGLGAGFWAGLGQGRYALYLPLIRRNE